MAARGWRARSLLALVPLALALLPTGPAGAAVAAQNDLYAVSCLSAHDCVAVGSALTTTRIGLAEAWDGTSWTIVPANAMGAGVTLDGVSCVSASWCAAVGYDDGGTVVEEYDGTSFGAFPLPPSTPRGSRLEAVECRSTAWCVAVGQRSGGALVVRYQHERWTTWSAPSPGAGVDTLTSVSCPSESWCMAVGYRSAAAGAETPIALWLHAGAWHVVAMALYGSSPEPDAVSCPNTSWCQAVGGSDGTAGASASQFTDHHWATMHAPTHQPTAVVSVDCVAEVWCTTVGNNGAGGRFATLEQFYEHYPSAPATRPPDVFAQLSCWAKEGCVAVGHDTGATPGTTSALADRWTGGTWVARTLPDLSY